MIMLGLQCVSACSEMQGLICKTGGNIQHSMGQQVGP